MRALLPISHGPEREVEPRRELFLRQVQLLAQRPRLLGIPRQHLYDILRERKPVSPAIAVRLGKLFGDGTGVWVRMQAAYDTWHAEREEDVSGIPTLRPRAA
jgi:addiction module HigA family antidote